MKTIPHMPPTPWQGKTSSVSSSVDFVRRWTATLLMTLAARPIVMLWATVTNPAAGVIATRPTTAPMQAPSAEGFLPRNQSKKIQPSMAEALAVLVVAKATAASPLAFRALPALKPNQPNQSMPVPSRTNGIFAGICSCPWMWAWRRSRMIAPASAAQPADMWTTVPPAKSLTPHLKKRPSGCHVAWASGQ